MKRSVAGVRNQGEGDQGMRLDAVLRNGQEREKHPLPTPAASGSPNVLKMGDFLSEGIFYIVVNRARARFTLLYLKSG